MNLPFLMKQETEMECYRANTFWDKEPETIKWIQSFSDGDVLYDIGANIGIYSLYFCSLYPNGHCFAFEPSTGNCARLFENVRLNGFVNITPFNWAVSNFISKVTFEENSTEIGSSGGQVRYKLDDKGVFVTSIDLLSHLLKVPNHIKIDIDGQEGSVIDGMICTISKREVKSILVEFDLDKPDYLLNVERIRQCGFTTENNFNTLKDHSRVRRAKEGIRCENIVFTRG
jgi:FkbM family methyltransferase